MAVSKLARRDGFAAMVLCFVGSLVGCNSTQAADRTDGFSKRLGDGSMVVLDKISYRETIKRIWHKPPDVPQGTVDRPSDTSDFLVDHYSLVRTVGTKADVIWQLEIRTPVGAYYNLGMPFIFWDVEIEGQKTYVFYSARIFAHLDVLTMGPSGGLSTINSIVLEDCMRNLGVAHFFRDSRRLGVKYTPGPGHGETRWEVIGTTLRKWEDEKNVLFLSGFCEK